MARMIDQYHPTSVGYPEMMMPDGSVRPHWLPMLNQLEAYGTESISSRWQRAQRVIRQNGITYNTFGDPAELNRPWELDPIPLIISPDEWDAVSKGLIQRAQLLNELLSDLYGDQQLLKKSILPAELIYANPSFHRACCQIAPRNRLHIDILAVDLVRTPNGEWQILKDLTQAPSGAGYALENRLVMSRTFPTMYRDSRVERLASFFSDMRDRLAALSPRPGRTPRIVILTPGPASESFFEHAYLARYLGYQLVQANDLTVRDNKVFLKTLGGLRQVDVILRRQDDFDCDPLEFGAGSQNGIPGLVQSAVAGEVVIANALGSGLAETPAMLPFLPLVSRHLLGEELELNSVPTLWCGQPAERQQIIDNLDSWVIKHAFPGSHEHAVFPAQLSKEDRVRLIERIEADPKSFIAQENTALSIAPCWLEGMMRPRHMMLRAFVTATHDGWRVMPGGLVRTSGQADSTVVAMEKGGGSKDAWVIARNEVARISLLPREGSELVPTRTDETLSSRVADNLFWLGRYIQRAELHSRMLRTILRRLTEETLPDGTPELPELIRALSIMTEQKPAKAVIESPIQNMDATIQYICDIIYKPEHPNNLFQALQQACRIGTMVRDRISIDTWRILDRLDHQLHRSSLDMPSMLDELLMILSAFSGLGYESMTHGYGWHFMDMGFRMERATMNAIIMRELLSHPDRYEEPVLDALLETCSSSITYRTRYQTSPKIVPLLDLLLVDSSNPRGIAFQLELINEHIRALSNLPRGGQIPEQIFATDLLRLVEHLDLSKASEVDEDGDRFMLNCLLNDIINRIQELSNLVTERYLSHVETTQQLFSLMGGDLPDTEVWR